MKQVVISDESYNIREIEVDGSWIENLGSDYRKYREKWALANQKHLFNFPLFLEVESSYVCNYRCPKCPSQALRQQKKGGFLGNELLDKIFLEVRKYKMPSITFSHGGDPLMRKDIPELIRKARKAGIIDRMFHTNGYLLSKEVSRRVIANGLTKINFSIDAASAQVYNKVRVGGDYETVIANINDFLRIKKDFGKSYPRVRVSFVVSKENKHEQTKFFDLWKDKVNLIAFQKCYDFSKMLSARYIPKVAKRKKFYCTQLWQLLTVTWKGDILICEHDYNHEYILGNLKTHTLHECWHSDTMNKFRELHQKNRWDEIPLCRKCVACVGIDK